MTIKSLQLDTIDLENGEIRLIGMHLCNKEDSIIESYIDETYLGKKYLAKTLILTHPNGEEGLRAYVNDILKEYDIFIKVPSYLVKTFTKGTE